jgi:hypothetical protein
MEPGSKTKFYSGGDLVATAAIIKGPSLQGNSKIMLLFKYLIWLRG